MENKKFKGNRPQHGRLTLSRKLKGLLSAIFKPRIPMCTGPKQYHFENQHLNIKPYPSAFKIFVDPGLAKPYPGLGITFDASDNVSISPNIYHGHFDGSDYAKDLTVPFEIKNGRIWESKPVIFDDIDPAAERKLLNQLHKSEYMDNSLDLHKGKYIRTLSGLYVDILFPSPEMFDIADIAHGLSREGRFANQTEDFYTVGQHCIEGAKRAHNKHKLAMLLHDAPEFIMKDLARPIKKQVDHYKYLEDKVMVVIAKKYGIQFPFDPEIKRIDHELLEWEYKNLILGHRDPDFRVMTMREVKAEFLTMFYELTKADA